MEIISRVQIESELMLLTEKKKSMRRKDARLIMATLRFLTGPQFHHHLRALEINRRFLQSTGKLIKVSNY